MRTAFLVCFLAILPGFAQTDDDLDGRAWRSMTSTDKLRFVGGYRSGYQRGASFSDYKNLLAHYQADN